MQGAKAKGICGHREAVCPPHPKAEVSLEHFRGEHGDSMSFPNGKSLSCSCFGFPWWLSLLNAALQGELVFLIFLDASQPSVRTV